MGDRLLDSWLTSLQMTTLTFLTVFMSKYEIGFKMPIPVSIACKGLRYWERFNLAVRHACFANFPEVLANFFPLAKRSALERVTREIDPGMRCLVPQISSSISIEVTKMRISRTLSSLLLVGCIICVAAPFSVGQGERPQRGQGGGGPGGGRGFGGGGFGGRGGIASLLTIKEVRDELKMEEEQTKEMEAFTKELRDEMQSQFAGFGGGRGGPGGPGGPGGGGGPGSGAAAPDMTKINDAIASMQLKSESKLGEILDPIQMDRLVGLFIQRDGARTLNSKIISTRLEITGDQKVKIADQEEIAGEEMRSLYGGGGGGGGDMREKMDKMRKDSEEKITGLLTAAQKAKMEELKGAKFEFPAQPPRGGPGGARGGNPQ